MQKTLFEKIWDDHVVRAGDDGVTLLYVDLHLVHEVTSPQAFEGLRLEGRRVRRPELTVATMDHAVPTLPGPIEDQMAKKQLDVLRANCAEFDIELHATGTGSEGIVHVIGPELGLTQPGKTIVCGDSHTSTHGALGALAIGIGTTEVEHVLATQTLAQQRPRTMLIEFVGALPYGLTPKDMILGAIGQVGVGGGTGHVVEYAGEAVRALSDRGPADDLQHVDRARRPRRDDRPRRHDLRLPGRAAARTAGSRLGTRARALAIAPIRSRRDVRHAHHRRRGGARSSGDLGHQPGHGRPRDRCRARPRQTSPTRTTEQPPSARSSTWGFGRANASRTSRSTTSSSAPARTRASRTCAQPLPWSRAGRSTPA